MREAQELYQGAWQMDSSTIRIASRNSMDVFYPGSDGYVLEKLRALIELHFKEQHSVRFYTDKLSTSLSTLNRLTKRLADRTANDLIQDRLHEEAVALLLHTTLPFKQISNILGICDPAYFSRCFKVRTGYCPREFRTSYRK
ncbi:MAG: helix-turn-helix domain-containing protein [Pedobacter sp.]|nr:MAG: helix-turn-helix domain-containing protein [Pedobacter sp.]